MHRPNDGAAPAVKKNGENRCEMEERLAHAEKPSPSGGHLKEIAVRTVSISPILAAVAAASFACMTLVAAMPQAEARKGSSPEATGIGAKIQAVPLRGAAGSLYCVGPGCSRTQSENKAPTTGTYKAPSGPGVRDHRGESPVGQPGPRPGKYQCGYHPETPGCRPIVRDHRGPIYQKHKGVWSVCTRKPDGGLSCTPVSAQPAPPGPPSPGRTQRK